MIPKKIHYCWFGEAKMPKLAIHCIQSWHEKMPEWEYVLWSEDNFDIESAPAYVQEAYAAKKYAFVSDYVRLYALEQQGGVYLDVDFEVYKSFEPLLNNVAFAGYEGSKRLPVMMGVLGSEAHGEWVSEALHHYANRMFVLTDGSFDMTPNTSFFTNQMEEKGLILNGKEQVFAGLHIYPVDYFCPMQTSGEYFLTENTYCEHKGLRSWSKEDNWKSRLLRHLSPALRTKIILFKKPEKKSRAEEEIML